MMRFVGFPCDEIQSFLAYFVTWQNHLSECFVFYFGPFTGQLISACTSCAAVLLNRFLFPLGCEFCAMIFYANSDSQGLNYY